MKYFNDDLMMELDLKNTFSRKSYGRIVVEKEEDIELVKEVIKDMDDFEYGYLPQDLICVHSEEIKLKYTHKFSDLDLNDLIHKCWCVGIKCYTIS